MTAVQAFAAHEAGGNWEPFEYELPELGDQEVEVEVLSCGICHSDLSMLDNEWKITRYPFVGGHEIIGRVASVGADVPSLKTGDIVGVGWNARSCMCCDQCISGNQNLCPLVEGTITHQHGGFADRVRCHWSWALPIPAELDVGASGPLLCGGITVFSPLVEYGISPLARVAVVGIGGLGHLALQFCRAWGCEVTAISRGRDIEPEARQLGAHDFLATDQTEELEAAAGRFDLILNTTNADLDWDRYIAALAPKGRLHTVGAAAKVSASVFPMIIGQKAFSSSPTGNVIHMRQMLNFASRHGVRPMVESFPFAEINQAFDRLRNGSARFRVVLQAS